MIILDNPATESWGGRGGRKGREMIPRIHHYSDASSIFFIVVLGIRDGGRHPSQFFGGLPASQPCQRFRQAGTAWSEPPAAVSSQHPDEKRLVRHWSSLLPRVVGFLKSLGQGCSRL